MQYVLLLNILYHSFLSSFSLEKRTIYRDLGTHPVGDKFFPVCSLLISQFDSITTILINRILIVLGS